VHFPNVGKTEYSGVVETARSAWRINSARARDAIRSALSRPNESIVICAGAQLAGKAEGAQFCPCGQSSRSTSGGFAAGDAAADIYGAHRATPTVSVLQPAAELWEVVGGHARVSQAQRAAKYSGRAADCIQIISDDARLRHDCPHLCAANSQVPFPPRARRANLVGWMITRSRCGLALLSVLHDTQLYGRLCKILRIFDVEVKARRVAPMTALQSSSTHRRGRA